jgi:hypothetical protein
VGRIGGSGTGVALLTRMKHDEAGGVRIGGSAGRIGGEGLRLRMARSDRGSSSGSGVAWAKLGGARPDRTRAGTA